MKQDFKVLAKVIAIPCGCLSLLTVLEFLVLFFFLEDRHSGLEIFFQDFEFIG